MPHIVLQISGYACVVYSIIPQLFSEIALFTQKITIWCVRDRGQGGERRLCFYLKENC